MCKVNRLESTGTCATLDVIGNIQIMVSNINYQPNNPYRQPSPSQPSSYSQSSQNKNSQPYLPFQPDFLLHQVQGISPDSVYQNFSNFTSVLPAALPEASLVVPLAGPIISTGIAGLDIYHTYKDSANKYKDLSPDERWRKTADKTGKRVEYQVLAAFVLPALALATAYKGLNRTLKYPWLPSAFVRHPKWYKAGGALIGLVALNGPISKVSTWITDWTWNPLIQHRKPKELDALRERLDSFAHTIGHWEQKAKSLFSPGS